VDLAAGPAEQRVIDRHGQRAGWHQQQHDQPGDGQAEVADLPPGAGEEVVRPVMRPGPGQVRAE